MHRNQSAQVSHFAMIPQPNIPRSSMRQQKTLKTSFDAGYLVPMYCKEILPGDTIRLRHTIFARLATPLFPVMDNLHADTFYFFVPCRLVWNNWKKFMGEQDNPGDSISYVIPQQVSPAGGYAPLSLQDYFGLPVTGQMGGAATKSHNALPIRAYNLIYNTWFRDQNLQNSAVVDLGDGPDATPAANYYLRRRGKRHDYFTSGLPWPQKGNTGVSIPLAGNAPIKTSVSSQVTGSQTSLQMRNASGGAFPTAGAIGTDGSGNTLGGSGSYSAIGGIYPSNLYADLSAAGGVLINQLRQSIMIQELLELDARGGTRYVEQILVHFGVVSPDFRLQRPEYIGGGSSPVNINPVAQTGQTGLTGGSTPMGTLAAMGTLLDHNSGFTYSATEHGYIIGLISVRADLTYQQGIHRMWTRSTRYDFYYPVLAHLGEKAVRNDEIYVQGTSADAETFAYQEAWAEYRYDPNMLTGLMRSTTAGTIDAWHLAQKFSSLPTLSDTFIQDTPPISRITAVGAAANGQQFIADMFFDQIAARPMPMYSVPHISGLLN